MAKTDKMARGVCMLLLIGIVLFLSREMIFSKKYIVFSDIDFGYFDSIYIERILGLFNENFSSMNFFNLSRLVFIYPLELISSLLDGTVPQLLLKLVIATVLLISSAGAYKLIEYLLLDHFKSFPTRLHYVGLIIPALFYTLNPWVIIRIQHIFLLAGYAAFPWILLYFLRLFPIYKESERLSTKLTWDDYSSAIKIGFFVCIGSAAIHYFFYYVIALGLIFLILLYKNFRIISSFNNLVRITIKKVFLLIGCITIFNAYWILTYITSMFITSVEPSNVNVVDTLQMFSRFSSVPNVLYLISYWWPMFEVNRYLNWSFWVGGGVFLALIFYIIFFRYGWHFYIRLFTWLTVMITILSLGVNTAIISDINVFVVTKVPIIGHIFRDPNKLIGVMALFYSILIGFGVDRTLFSLRSLGFPKVIQLFFILILMVSFHFYFKPFSDVFINHYYDSVEVPKEYEEVQENYIEGGKILWIPTLEHMLLSNGISSFDWNDTENSELIKASSDFHLYSSKKPTIFQNENNHGMVRYTSTYLQHLLDRGTAQHLGEFISWMGFNEVGFHQDVYGHEERQAFNKNVLEQQQDLEKHYEDDVFTLYKTLADDSNVHGVNKLIYSTKQIPNIFSLLDYKKDLNVSATDTGLFWAQLQKQQPPLNENTLLVGDSYLDFIIPYIDEKYAYYPFDYINTGNPYKGWGKTRVQEADWFWTLKMNQLNNNWDYDYGKGLMYTYAPYKLNIEPHKVSSYKGKPLITMEDILNDFFEPENEDVFRLTPFLENNRESAALEGIVQSKDANGELWNVARSKLVDLKEINLSKFLRIRVKMSGVNAGSVHFKVRFFNKESEEIQVGFVSSSNVLSEYNQSEFFNDFVIPVEARFFRIDILSNQYDSKPTYLWIHDFEISNLSDAGVQNKFILPLREKEEKSYRILVRMFHSKVGGTTTFTTGKSSIQVNTKNGKDRFVWTDLGDIPFGNGELEIIPSDGLTSINSIVAIPSSKFEEIKLNAETKLKGIQIDTSLIRTDYTVRDEIDTTIFKEKYTTPSSIEDSVIPMVNGKMVKNVDILFDQSFTPSIIGNVMENHSLHYKILRNGKTIYEDGNPGKKALARNFQNTVGEVNNSPNQYYLSMSEIQDTSWSMERYDFSPVFLEKGSYQIEITAVSNVSNSIDKNTTHVLELGEIIVPKELVGSDEQAIRFANMGYEEAQINLNKVEVNGAIQFANEPTESKQWIIYTTDPVEVKKGERYIFEFNLHHTGVEEMHGKLQLLNNEKQLYKSTVLEGSSNQMYVVIKVEQDGFVQPTFLFKGKNDESGLFRLDEARMYPVDSLVKIESSHLLPENQLEDVVGNVKESNGHIVLKETEYAIHNEAYQGVWRLYGDDVKNPYIINFFHNGFYIGKESLTGSIKIVRAMQIPYFIGLVLLVIASIILLFFLCIENSLFQKRVRIKRE
ncbi:MFS transporter [Lysinibacillus sp. BW-2-10]|uniref:MFS transporter n=1 Tax=Lysinibacillus sp. BW-2-10 TaxID=2590030 RepID=UPI00117F391E|nr:MFS transporter [Lysinibacillus sp. BW-2-10]TSI05942.1 MFS transporter [Lysinibacillus sp. BW-2-10]